MNTSQETMNHPLRGGSDYAPNSYLPSYGLVDWVITHLSSPDRPFESRRNLASLAVSTSDQMNKLNFGQTDIEILVSSLEQYQDEQQLIDGTNIGALTRNQRIKFGRDVLTSAHDLETKTYFFQDVIEAMEAQRMSPKQILNNLRENMEGVVRNTCRQYINWARKEVVSKRQAKKVELSLNNLLLNESLDLNSPRKLAVKQMNETDSIFRAQQIYDNTAPQIREKIRQIAVGIVWPGRS